MSLNENPNQHQNNPRKSNAAAFREEKYDREVSVPFLNYTGSRKTAVC